MRYEATFNIDFRGPRNVNTYNQLLNALAATGWTYCGTSAMILIEGTQDEVNTAMEVIAKGLIRVGCLQHLTFTVQGVGDPRPAPAARNHRKALDKILDESWPSKTTRLRTAS